VEVKVAHSEKLVGSRDVELARRWGVRVGPWLWGARLRILFVIDGRVELSSGPEDFGLGPVLDTLRDASFAWWVKFEVDVARRGEGDPMETLQPGPYTPKYLHFRFGQPGFSLDGYDQVWFFADNPRNEPLPIDDPKYSPLSDFELRLLAEWMDRGGGVFAVGDHFNLGASVCSRIPRVRTMRKWTEQQGVPPQFGRERNQTLQPAPVTEVEKEGDVVPQPIEPAYRVTATSLLTRTLVPHPLLCAPSGIIDKFPDHMHEGEVIEDGDVELDRPLGIPGFEGVEYPTADGERPRPHVVAHGWTTQQPLDLVAFRRLENRDFIFGTRRRYPLIGAYDGDPVGIGRVVVDSTWHHWFSLNLDGFRTANRPVYELMQAYYRNVGLWLATPGQRAAMLFAATWGAIVSDPMAFPLALRQNLWKVGEKALDVIGRTATQCTLIDWTVPWLDLKAMEAFFVPPDLPESEPCPSCLPTDLLVRAMVGGIGTGILETAVEYHDALLRGNRPRLDPDTISRNAAQGAEDGHRALVAVLSDSATEKVAGRLAEGFRPLEPESIPIPVETVALRVVAARLQLTDPTDSVIVDGRITLTARVKVGESVVAFEVIDRLETPPFEASGAFADLDRVLLETSLQSGESLTVEVLAGKWGLDAVRPEHVRFTETLLGDPSTWLGIHVPSSAQAWRLWYRVERVDAEQ
jgi:hypothetical protein